jgi:outer membrane protein TolC
MIASTVLSIIFIPVLYVAIRTIAPGRGRRAADDEEGGDATLHDAPAGSGHGAAGPATAAGLGLLLAFVAPAQAGAQTPAAIEAVGFEDAVARAVEKNPTVAIASANILRAQGLMEQVRSSYLPRVTANVTNSTLDKEIAFDTGVVQPRNQTTFGLSLSAPLLAAARWAATSQAKDRVEVARLASADARKQVAVTAAAAYLGVIAQKRLLETAERSLETARSQADYNRKRREGGVGSRLNELRAALAVSMDETLVERSRLNVRRSQEALGVVLGSAGPVDVRDEPAFDVSSADILGDLASGEGLSLRSDLRLASAEQRAAQNVLDGSSKDWWPTLSMSFDPQAVSPSGLFQEKRSWRLTFQVSQTIYNGGERAGAQLERRANAQAADAALARLRIQASAEVRESREAVATCERSLASAKRAAEQADEVLKITIAAFDAGATTNIEVIEAQRSARDMGTALAQAEDALRQARFDLLVALGRFPR